MPHLLPAGTCYPLPTGLPLAGLFAHSLILEPENTNSLVPTLPPALASFYTPGAFL